MTPAKAPALTLDALAERVVARSKIDVITVTAVFRACVAELQDDLRRFRVAELPELLRITLVVQPATKARLGINPFTKQPVTFAAKPPSARFSVRPTSALGKLAAEWLEQKKLGSAFELDDDDRYDPMME